MTAKLCIWPYLNCASFEEKFILNLPWNGENANPHIWIASTRECLVFFHYKISVFKIAHCLLVWNMYWNNLDWNKLKHRFYTFLRIFWYFLFATIGLNCNHVNYKLFTAISNLQRVFDALKIDLGRNINLTRLQTILEVISVIILKQQQTL